MSPSDREHALASCASLDELPPAQRMRLAHTSHAVVLARGASLKDAQVEVIRLVAAGCLQQVVMGEDGREFTARLLVRGDALVASARVRDDDTWRASAREQSLVLEFSWQALVNCCGDVGASALRASVARQEARCLKERLTDLALYALDARVARTLYRLHMRSARSAALRLHRLDQSLIASLAGGTRPRVNQALHKLQTLGAIEIRGGVISVAALAPLARAGHITPGTAVT